AQNRGSEMNFMGLPDEYAGENSKTVIIPIAYEKNTTYGQGASRGADEIIAASRHIEYYDDELCKEPYESGIKLLKTLRCSNLLPEEAQERIREHVTPHIKKFTIALGGDHSITPAIVSAHSKEHKDTSILMLDAHADLRYSWKGSQYNHACVARRLAPNHKIAIVGVRAMDLSEREYADSNPNVKLIGAKEFNSEKIQEILAHLTQKVYVSIDVDAFDPSLIKNTGTPEPGGLLWYPTLELLKKTFEEKEVIGADIVEFAPEAAYRAEAFALAKLAYKLCAYKHALRNQ
ncbi:agmatinase, partial [Candidatus Woesearchaeota archaeon]